MTNVPVLLKYQDICLCNSSRSVSFKVLVLFQFAQLRIPSKSSGICPVRNWHTILVPYNKLHHLLIFPGFSLSNMFQNRCKWCFDM